MISPERRRAAILPPVDALTGMLASAYADAAMAGASMPLAVDVFEPLRAQILQATDPYLLDQAYSAVIARVATDRLLPMATGMRAGYREALAARARGFVLQSFGESLDSGRHDWLRLLAEALGEFCLPLVDALTSTGWLPPEVEGQRVRYADGGRRARRNEWLDIRPMIDELLGVAALAPLERALLLAMRAEIDWYWVGDIRRGMRDAERVGVLAPASPRAAEVAVEALLLSGRPEEAQETVGRALAAHPAHGGLHTSSVNCAMALSTGLDEVEKRLVAALHDAPHASELYGRLVVVYAAQGLQNDPRMTVLVAQADAIDPQEAYDHRVNLAAAYGLAGATDRAVAVLEECARSEPDRLPAHIALARLHLQSGDLSAAREAIGRGVAVAPDDVECLAVGAAVLQAQGDLPGALDWCRRAAEQPVKRALALVSLARCEAAAGLLPAAEQHAGEALAANPWDDDVLDGAAEVARGLWQRDGHDAARRLLAAPDDVPAAPFHLRLGRLASELGDTSLAVQELAQAVELSPLRASWHRELAASLRAERRWEEAEAALDRARALDRDDETHADALATVHNAHGNALFEAGDYAGAVPLYARAAELRERDAVLHHNLGLALEHSAEPGRRLENLTRAVDELARAVELAPDDISYEVYRTTLAAQADRIRRFSELISTPSVQPLLAVEIADDLVPEVDPAQRGARLFDEEIPRLRAALESDLGFPVPGIRFRGAALRPGAFRVLVQGVVVVSGTARAGLDCVLGPADVLVERGAAQEALVPATDPVEGGPCAWASSDTLDALDLSGLERLSMTDFVLRHVQDAVLRRPAAFFGLQTALGWMAGHADTGTGGPEDHRGARRRLVVARALRSLVQDGVRLDVTVLRAVEAAAEGTLTDHEAAIVAVPETVSRTRAALARLLPGGAPLDPLEVPDEATEQIATQGFLEPEEAERILGAVRAKEGRGVVLVVGHPAARGYVQRLLADELDLRIGRDVSVLTTDEVALLPAESMQGAPS